MHLRQASRQSECVITQNRRRSDHWTDKSLRKSVCRNDKIITLATSVHRHCAHALRCCLENGRAVLLGIDVKIAAQPMEYRGSGPPDAVDASTAVDGCSDRCTSVRFGHDGSSIVPSGTPADRPSAVPKHPFRRLRASGICSSSAFPRCRYEQSSVLCLPAAAARPVLPNQ